MGITVDLVQLNELVHVYVFRKSLAPTHVLHIADAVWSDPETKSGEGIYRLNGVLYNLDRFKGFSLYEQREGKPYQADIEAHVAAYRGHIPQYVESPIWFARGLKALLDDHTVRFDHGVSFEVHVNENDDGAVTVIHPNLWIAFWNAVVLACQD